MNKVCLLLVSSFICAHIDAMENKEKFFPDEGLELEQPYGMVMGYDDDYKFADVLHHHPELFQKFGHRVIKEKLGNKAFAFYAAYSNHDTTKKIERYTKAVTYRLATVCQAPEEVTDKLLIEAEQQIPFTLYELSYIETGDRHWDKNPTIIQSKMKTHDKQREYLNKLLYNLKHQIEEKQK